MSVSAAVILPHFVEVKLTHLGKDGDFDAADHADSGANSGDQGISPSRRFDSRYRQEVGRVQEHGQAVRQKYRSGAVCAAGCPTDQPRSVPEPHSFTALVKIDDDTRSLVFEEHAHTDTADTVGTRDHNTRAAYLHIIGDAAVSVLAIVGLVLAKIFGWLWMDPLAGLAGALVIANWSYGLIRDTGAILVDLNPDAALNRRVQSAIESAGDSLVDLHFWRLGPGHFSAVAAVATGMQTHDTRYFHGLLRAIPGLSHVTVKVQHSDGC